MNVPFKSGPVDFCNVTVTHTHPDQEDRIRTYVWLPLGNKWNGRFLAMGGGGWATGFEGALGPAVANGYAGANTDGGHSFHIENEPFQAASWALKKPGVVDLEALKNFASIGIDDMTHIAKAIIAEFYGQPIKYSYWNGCSTGGRQGLMQAQRFPKNYDGIIASAPAINWVSFVVAEFWGHLRMAVDKFFPPPCELMAIQEAAIEACDELDGVKDGVVAAPGQCKFNAESAVGRKCCNGRRVSKSAAKLANAAYEGPTRDGKPLWFGLTHESPLAKEPAPGPPGGLLQNICDDNNENCKMFTFPITFDWIRLFLSKDPNYNPLTMSENDFFKFLDISRKKYDSIIGTSNTDLSEFRDAGGKMITWHGLADQYIFPNGSSNYYEGVLAGDPNAADYYRYFEAPGVEHCGGGPGARPWDVFRSLVNWVERGTAPDVVDAVAFPKQESEPVKNRILCPYPQVAAYVGGDPNSRASFKCSANFGAKKADSNKDKDEL